MKKKEKGQYGYIDYYKKGKLLVTLILAIMIASIILSMLLAFGDTGRIGNYIRDTPCSAVCKVSDCLYYVCEISDDAAGCL